MIFDFGSLVGYQFTWKYPELVNKVVSMDIGMGIMKTGLPPGTPPCTALLGYQQVNVEAFLTHNNSLRVVEHSSRRSMPLLNLALKHINVVALWPAKKYIPFERKIQKKTLENIAFGPLFKKGQLKKMKMKCTPNCHYANSLIL